MDQTPEPPRASGWGEDGAVREAPLHGSNLISLILFHRFRAPTGARTPSSERPPALLNSRGQSWCQALRPAGGASRCGCPAGRVGCSARAPRGPERPGQRLCPWGAKTGPSRPLCVPSGRTRAPTGYLDPWLSPPGGASVVYRYLLRTWGIFYPQGFQLSCLRGGGVVVVCLFVLFVIFLSWLSRRVAGFSWRGPTRLPFK